jgi:hypothetical protein
MSQSSVSGRSTDGYAGGEQSQSILTNHRRSNADFHARAFLNEFLQFQNSRISFFE